ncbi:MAG: hypothetical protein GY845_35345 [Planctomycetes bacterium]|nr:hypothetical protein [Planctomycetota bacterium]
MSLQWMRDDALFLRKNGRLQGCLALLLCLVDAQAAQYSHSNNGNRSRYCDYLKTRLVDLGHDESYRIEEKDCLFHLSEIIYEYFRCFLVHEGNPRDNTEYEVQLKYEKNPKSVFGAGILIDRPSKQFVVQAEWLIDVLLVVTEDNYET